MLNRHSGSIAPLPTVFVLKINNLLLPGVSLIDSPVLVVIPAFDPPVSLLDLVDVLTLQHGLGLVVVNDGSAPRFEPLFAAIASRPGVQLVANSRNLGKGAALRAGFNQALVHSPQLVGLVTTDADGQHAPADIAALACCATTHPHHLGLGFRHFSRSVPLRSRVGNRLSRLLYRLLLRIPLKDTQTGLRYLPRALVISSLELETNGYEFETEQLILAARLKMPIVELPIQTIYTPSGQLSHFSPFFDSLRIYFVVIRYTLSSIVTSLFDFIVFALAVQAGSGIIGANLFSRSLALFLQFALLGSFVFRSSAGVFRFFAFVAYVGVMGLLSGFLQTQLPLGTIIGAFATKAIVEIGIYIFNFLFLRDILFAIRRP